MAFTMRTGKPSGNKFYITTDKGGYSQCVKGSPTDSAANALANCVGYACGRFNEIIGSMKYPKFYTNAENFIEVAEKYGLKISNVPVDGGIMVFQKGATLKGSDGAGHVMIVEKVYDDNHIYTSESGWGGPAFWNAHRYNTNGRWGMAAGYKFRGCIVNPAVKEEVNKPASNASKATITVDGLWGPATTRKAQQVFGTPVDGIVSAQYSAYKASNPGLLSSTFEWKAKPGSGGSALIKAIQKKVGATQDGYIGPATIKAMQKWLGTPVDGCVSNPSAMVKAFQTWLNKQ